MDTDDDDWLHQIQTQLKNYDDMFQHDRNISEDPIDQPDRYLVESAWIEPPLPAHRIPPDPQKETDHVANRYKLNLHIHDKRVSRLGLHHRPFAMVDGLTEGNDWSENSDGSWFIPSLDLHPVEQSECSDVTYDENFAMDGLQFNKCETPQNTSSLPFDPAIQSDTGANANITSDLSILTDVQWVEPVKCESAKKGAEIDIRAIGKYTIRGTTLTVNVYYCPDAHGTIISPTAIVRQHSSQFIGYQKFVNVDKSQGEITLISREGENVQIPLVGTNDLWYHTINHQSPLEEQMKYLTSQMTKGVTINRLSDAAQWELWHQRLAHPGTNVLQATHKHADGVPKLHGNAFYRCPSCMTSKTTKLPGHHQNLGATRTHKSLAQQTSKTPAARISPSPGDEEMDDFEEYVDSLYLPEALPGQHFHIDFGFVRGSKFRVKTENGEGPTITSVDGKNFYCLIVDRATRYMWVYLSNTKEPPVEPVRMILRKFGANITHKTVRSDQDKALGKSVEFLAMLKEEEFTPELTGTDSSPQNAIGERPHRDLAQMMRCMLHSAELGPAYWSFALAHAIYIKTRRPHSAIRTTPFQAFTGKRPDLSRLRILRVCS